MDKNPLFNFQHTERIPEGTAGSGAPDRVAGRSARRAQAGQRRGKIRTDLQILALRAARTVRGEDGARPKAALDHPPANGFPFPLVISPDFSLELTGFFPGKHLIYFLVLKMKDFWNFVLDDCILDFDAEQVYLKSQVTNLKNKKVTSNPKLQTLEKN